MDVKVFSMNCWGIPIVSAHRADRFRQIALYIEKQDYDFVMLQEVWSRNDFYFLRDKFLEKYPHSHYFYSGFSGSGMCVFSKWVIIHAFFHKWSMNGYVHKINHGDWFGGKGVALVHAIVKGIKFNIYCAHLHAEYNRENDEYLVCRVIQAFETAQFIKISAKFADVSILAGDLNIEPLDLAYRFMVKLGGLRDAFIEHGDASIHSTVWNNRNTFTPKKVLKSGKDGPRIDYILFRGSEAASVKLIKYDMPLEAKIPGRSYSYSDHEAICAQMLVTRGGAKDGGGGGDDGLTKDIDEGLQILQKGMKQAQMAKLFYWFWTFVMLFVIVGSFSIPDEFYFYINLVRILFTILLVYMFIMAVLWNKFEVNAIKNAIKSMQIFRRGLKDD